jgi:exopolyphosphatase/guanosine-5'-triphosphate,3'-diphosphate pyrophosphatase
VIVSAIDIGSNSVRMLTIGEAGAETRREVEVTGLARGLDASRLLSAEVVAETEVVLERFARLVEVDGSEAVGVVATSASRDAINGPDVMKRFERILGVSPEDIDGTREASLSFAGATAGLHGRSHVVVDIGGGSTEIVAGTHVVTWTNSYDIGSVRLTDRCSLRYPASSRELADAREAVRSVLGNSKQPSSTEIIGVAGTFTSIAGIVLGLDRYDRSRVPGTELSKGEIDATIELLADMRVDEVAAIPSLDPRRAPVILGGALVASEVMAALGTATVTVSEHDLLDGLAAEVARAG